MSDFSFMKTGISAPADASALDHGMVDKYMCLLEMFMEDSLLASYRYTKIKRKKGINKVRMQKGLKYVAKTFFEAPDMEERFQSLMRERQQVDEGSDDEDDDDDDGDYCDEENIDDDDDADSDVDDDDCDEGQGDEQNEKDPTTRKKMYHADVCDDDEFCARVDMASEEWNNWLPDDAAQVFIKRSIDAIS